MLNLEQIIDKLPDRRFSYTYSSGVTISLWHDHNMWHGRITDATQYEKVGAVAPTFQGDVYAYH